MRRAEASHGPARESGKPIELARPPLGKKHLDAVSRDADNLTLQHLFHGDAKPNEPSADRSELLSDPEAASEADRCDRGAPCRPSAISCDGCKHHLIQRKANGESSCTAGSGSEPAVFVQPKLTVSQPGDPAEAEADRMAEAAASGTPVHACGNNSCPGGSCSSCHLGSGVHRKAKPGSGAVRAPASLTQAMGSGGRPLESPVRASMEHSLGADFSGVRVHTGPAAAASARSIGALAYTAGSDVVFDSGRYAPESNEGRKLLAHELAHVVQQGSGAPEETVHRYCDPTTHSCPPGTEQPFSPASSNPLSSASSTASTPAFRVEIMTADEYAASTGQSIETLPERTRLSADAAGFGSTLNPPQWAAGAGAGAMCPVMPAFPLPQTTTGFLWSGGHVSDFAIVEGESLFRGFRASLLRHGASDLERSVLGQLLLGDRGGWVATRSLNRGVVGSWANDWLFPYFSDATAVFPDRNLTPEQARQFAEFLRSRTSDFAGKDYRFSPPPRGSRAWVSAFGETGPDFVPPETVNCINRPVDIHEQAMGGETALGPGRPGERSGYAKDMEPWLEQSHPGVRTARIGPTMQARAAVGVIRVGGYLLLLYGAYKTAERISNATPEELPMVVGEETGSWIGGWVGSVLASALGGAFVCAETGPGAILCAAAFGIAGGVTGSTVGSTWAHDVVEGVELMNDPARLMETSVQMFGSDEDRRRFYEDREILEAAGL